MQIMESGGRNGGTENEGGRRRETYNRYSGSLEGLRQFNHYVREHVVVLRPLGIRRIQVESRAFVVLRFSACGNMQGGGRTDTKIPVVRLAFDARAAWGGVWEEERDALLGRGAEEIAFLRSG